MGVARAPRPAWQAWQAFRIDPMLVCVVYLAFGATASVAPAATLTAAGVGLAALQRRLATSALAMAALCLALGWARANWVVSEHVRQQDEGRELLPAPSRCAATGRITSSPTQRSGNLRFDAELTELDCGGKRSGRSWPTRLYLPSADAGAPRPARGDIFSVIADLAPVSAFRNFDLPDPRPAAARRGAVLSGAALSFELERRTLTLCALVDRARAHVRERIHATFAAPVSGMARALVLGENDLDPDDEQAFQRSGLAHLLAVSGTHLIIAVLAFVRGLQALLRRWPWLAARCDVSRSAALLGICLAPLYADFAGGSGSAWRAAWMLCTVLGVRAGGRHVFPSRILAASLGAGWLQDGLVVFDPSFSLSIAATTGLIAMGRRLDENRLAQASALTHPGAPDVGRAARALSRAALTTLAATLPCIPILVSISPGLSLTSVAANLLAAPLGEAVALPFCLAHALAFPLPALERGIALVASGALALIAAVARASASVDWLYFEVPPPTEWHLACLMAGCAACLAAAGQPWLARGCAHPRPCGSPHPPALSEGLEPRHHLSSSAAATHTARPAPIREKPQPPCGSWVPSTKLHVDAPAADTSRLFIAALTLQSRIDAPDQPWLPRARPGGLALNCNRRLPHDIPGLQSPQADDDRPVRLPLRASLSSATLTAWAAAACVALLLVTEAATRYQHSAPYGRRYNRLRVTALDVGQGDATLIDLPDGRLMLIDGGGFVGVPLDPGERVILPTLRARRRDRIDILVLTHPHPDHYGGLASVVSRVDIGEFWYGGPDRALEATARSLPAVATPLESAGLDARADHQHPLPPQLDPHPNPGFSPYARLLELLTQRGVVRRSAAELCAGLPPGDAAIQLLHPCPSVVSDQPANDNSLVLRIQNGAHAALLVGDAERWAEERLLATQGNALTADFLKVGHHGSRTSSSPEFIQRVTPRYASISCGIRNRFGHPHREVLESLERAGAVPLRLDRLGAVRWTADGSSQVVTTFSDGEPVAGRSADNAVLDERRLVADLPESLRPPMRVVSAHPPSPTPWLTR